MHFLNITSSCLHLQRSAIQFHFMCEKATAKTILPKLSNSHHSTGKYRQKEIYLLLEGIPLSNSLTQHVCGQLAQLARHQVLMSPRLPWNARNLLSQSCKSHYPFTAFTTWAACSMSAGLQPPGLSFCLKFFQPAKDFFMFTVCRAGGLMIMNSRRLTLIPPL